jgi:hypothetical protein
LLIIGTISFNIGCNSNSIEPSIPITTSVTKQTVSTFFESKISNSDLIDALIDLRNAELDKIHFEVDMVAEVFSSVKD